nr:replication initiator protein A [Pseudoflavonifractor sp. MSJ-37]
MEQEITFDYFYGSASERSSYYRIPRLRVTGPQFRKSSTDAKLLYGLMLDRMGLSAKNR